MNVEERLREIIIRHVNEYSSRMTKKEVMQIAEVMEKVIARLIDEDNDKLNNSRG